MEQLLEHGSLWKIIKTKNMKRFTILLTQMIIVFGLSAQEQPNIIFMLSDNLGYGDLGCYGGGIILSLIHISEPTRPY